MKFRFSLQLVFCFAALAHAGNLLPGDTDNFPGAYEVRFTRGQPTVTGRIPPPWTAEFEESRGEARLVFGPDPVRERPSFGLFNLGGPRALTLSTQPAVEVTPGTEYELRFDLLTQNGARGTLRLSGAVRRIVPLRDTRGIWIGQREVFTAESNRLQLEFSNAGDGPDQGVFLSRLVLRPTGAEAGSRPEAGPVLLPGWYGDLQREFAPVGQATFLNGTDPDSVTRQAAGGNLFEQDELPFRVFRRMQVERAGMTPQSERIRISNREPVLKGETLMLVFHARGEKTPQPEDDGGGPVIQAIIRGPEQLEVPHTIRWQWNEPNRTQKLREAWTRYELPARWNAPRDMQPGEIQFEIWMGHKAQQVDVGGFALMSFRDADRNALPRTAFRYRGDDTEAPWREEAEARIREHRMGTLRLLVLDAEGNPVPNVRVTMDMQQHAFRFGTNIDFLTWHGRTRLPRPFTEDDALQYRTRSMSYFNRVVIDDVFRWPVWETARAAEGFKTLLEELIEYYTTRGVSLGAGPLLIPGAMHAPNPLPQNLMEAKTEAIRERISIAESLIRDWTVVRETAGNRDLLQEHGPELLLTAFEAARGTDENARLWMEEVDIRHAILNGSFLDHEIPANQGWPGWLRDRGFPPYGLAVHASGGLLFNFAPEQWWRIFDGFESRFGMPLRFTRMQIPIQDADDPVQQQVQLRHFRDTLITLFAHPAVEGVDFSGFWAGAHPVPSSAFWDLDWTPTPLGELYLDLVYSQWWSNRAATTGPDGIATLTAFHGTHQITLRLGDREARAIRELHGKLTEVTLEF